MSFYTVFCLPIPEPTKMSLHPELAEALADPAFSAPLPSPPEGVPTLFNLISKCLKPCLGILLENQTNGLETCCFIILAIERRCHL